MLLVGGFIAFVILLLAGMWALSMLGPRAATEEDLARSKDLNSAEVEARRAEITKLRVQFDALADDGSVSTQDLEILQLAIARQRELVKLLPYPDAADLDLLASFEERYATEAGGALHRASIEAEAAAQKAVTEGRREDAIAAYTQAIEQQEEINLVYARGEYRDVPRQRRLEYERENLQAEPLARQAKELTQEARLLLEEDPPKAAELLQQAAELHARLARDFRSSRFTDRAAEREVQALLVDVEAADFYRRRENLRAACATAMEEGRYADAAEAVEKAIDVQRELTSRFPASSHANSGILEDLERDRQSALSAGLAASIEEHEAELRRLLRTRQAEAAAALAADYYREVRQLHDRFQASRFVDEARLLEARYLNLKRDDFAFIQKAVDERLRAIPGVEEREMLSTEVPQILFSLVMGTNPSSQSGDLLPVDSVDFAAARDFCQRLGWILGYPVVLPTRADFEGALGEVVPATVREEAWSSQNTDRRTQPVGTRAANPAGFFDLLGNVAEWIDEYRPGDEREALVIGGSVRDGAQSLLRVPSGYVDLNERSRFTGFRIVVDLSAETDAAGK